MFIRNMKCFRIVFIGIFCFLSIMSFGQDKVTLLKERLEKSAEEDKPRVLNMLSKTLLRKNRSESLSYAEQAIKLSKELGDVKEEVDGYLNKAVALSALRKHGEAIIILKKVLKIDEEFGNKPSQAYDLNLLGKEYLALSKYSESKKYYTNSYKIYSELKDNKALAFVTASLGEVEKKEGNRKEAVEWYEKSLKHSIKAKDKRREVASMSAIGAINANRGDFDKAIQQLEEAKQKAKEYGLKSAEKSIDKNIFLVKENKNRKEIATTDLDRELAAKKDEQIADLENITVKSMAQIEQLSESMQILELKKRLEKESYDREIKEREEEKSKLEQEKKLAESEALASRAEKEKEQAKNKLLAAENSRQNIMLIAGTVVLALFVVLIMFILKGYRDKKKSNKVLLNKNKLIEDQKNSLEIQKEELEVKNHNIKESLDYAQKIQTSILPSIDGLKDKFSDSFVFFRPKDIVSGDFYWYYEYGNKLYVSVSDCTGHGVPGAFMSIIGNNLIEKAIVEKRIEKPSEVLAFMSKGINEQLGMTKGSSDVKDGMDMTLICINKATNKLSFSGARNPLYFYREGNLEEIKATKMSVGYNSRKVASEFENLEFDLQKGDRLYMFSDGFADQKGGPKGKKFYYKPFREILQGSGTQPMDFQRDLLEKTIVDWMGETEQLDDMLVLGIEI